MSTDRKGYGRIGTHKKKKIAHRIAYSAVHGGIQKGMCACHTCDNPRCCNPAHIFEGTFKDNTQDCIRKGRFKMPPRNDVRGEKNGAARLNIEQVLDIKSKYRSGMRIMHICQHYPDVTRSCIEGVVYGYNWKDVLW